MADMTEEQLNRKITFTIIKTLWKLRAGPRKMNLSLLYGRKVTPLMPANERTFDELVRYGREPSDAVQLKFDELSDTLGIDRGYFRGTVPLDLPNFGAEEWQAYFQGGADREVAKEFEQELTECLKMLPHELEMEECHGRGFALYQLYFYYVLDTVVQTEQSGIVGILCGIMESVDLKTLLSTDKEILQRYNGLLQKHATYTATALIT